MERNILEYDNRFSDAASIYFNSIGNLRRYICKKLEFCEAATPLVRCGVFVYIFFTSHQSIMGIMANLYFVVEPVENITCTH